MLLSIEGVTGIGKSTLQTALCRHYESRTLLIDFEKHPYLHLPNMAESSYVDHALERELIFMLMGYHQLRNSKSTNGLVISDFAFGRFEVFASAVLKDAELTGLFLPCFRYLCKELQKPDLIIRLTAKPEFTLERIRHRNRPNEEYLNVAYLAALENGFVRCFDTGGGNVILIDAESYDVLADDQTIEMIAEKLESALPKLKDFKKNARP